MSLFMWSVWAIVLITQNFSFTFVSRARNSGSLSKHAWAAIMSNGIWFAGQLMAVSAFMGIITGKFGIKLALFAAAYYTAFTVAGSLLAHWWALKTEKGKGAVGANSKYHQVTNDEWEVIVDAINHIQTARASTPRLIGSLGSRQSGYRSAKLGG